MEQFPEQERDLAHERDMEMLRREQLRADIGDDDDMQDILDDIAEDDFYAMGDPDEYLEEFPEAFDHEFED